MNALILLSHGSRMAGSNQEMADLAKRLGDLEDNPFAHVRFAFQQFARPDFAAVVDDLAGRGVSDITVLPLFLAAGSHVRTDVPEMIRSVGRRHAGLKIHIAPHLGATAGLARFLLDSARQHLGV